MHSPLESGQPEIRSRFHWNLSSPTDDEIVDRKSCTTNRSISRKLLWYTRWGPHSFAFLNYARKPPISFVWCENHLFTHFIELKLREISPLPCKMGSGDSNNINNNNYCRGINCVESSLMVISPKYLIICIIRINAETNRVDGRNNFCAKTTNYIRKVQVVKLIIHRISLRQSYKYMCKCMHFFRIFNGLL